MITARFEEIIRSLGEALNIKLTPDKNNACLLKISSGVKVQLEMDRTGRQLIIGAQLGNIPAGRYRAEILKEAMIANGHYPRIGKFGFSSRTGQLVLFEFKQADQINGDQLVLFLEPFIKKAQSWKETIDKGGIRP